MTLVFILLVVYQIKHFVADFPLQTPYMLGKFKDEGWVGPLSAHAGVHAGFTFLIVTFACTDLMFAFAAALFDFIIHFTMDRIKASPRLLGQYQALSKADYMRGASPTQLRSNTFFWWSLGFDQAIHHLTHYFIIGAVYAHRMFPGHV